jgi:RNA polymerase sigma factor (sigma-70 family)
MSKHISNKQYEDALNNNNNRAIIEHACKTFIGIIPDDELQHCKLIALWESLQRYRPEKGKKFTSFLYQKVRWECYKALKQINKEKRYVSIIEDVVGKDSDENFDEWLELLPDKESKKLIEQRFLQKMTLKEIGKYHGYSYETARKRINKIINYIHAICTKS